ncbi:MAG: CDGSH-type Zn-finger protein [Phenylobacterium sp.]|jgi:CDGSH-type Zn-finger protein
MALTAGFGYSLCISPVKKHKAMSKLQPVVAAKQPIAVEVEQGRSYLWCTCGQSKRQPWCDGSHGGTGFTPLPYTAKQSKTVFFCACKQSKNPPLCDGAHNKL